MLSSELKSKINTLWDKFWSRGISNPITAIEQISYLLFMKRLDEIDIQAKDAAKKSGKRFTSIFKSKEDCRWSNFHELPAEQMLKRVTQKVFPFIKKINNNNEPFARHMKDAVFSIKNAALLEDAVKAIDDIYIDIKQQQIEGQQFQDTQGDVYEYLLNEVGQAGKNGQFRTPRHIIQLICELINPKVSDKICDPACGTGGFLVGAYQHILTKNTTPSELTEDENGFTRFKKHGGNKIKDDETWDKLRNKMFFGFDMDPTMVRIGLMNLILHGVTIPQIENIDALSKKFDSLNQDGQYSVIMANPPFTGRIDVKGKSDKLQIQGNQSELLFIIRISKMLKKNGRAAIIVPEGTLFGNSKAQRFVREMLLKDNNVEAVISLPPGIFKPYSGVKTSIILFTKVGENSSRFNTERVWFYELQNDGYSLDDNRRKLSENPLPAVVSAFEKRTNSKRINKNHFYVELDKIRNADFNLSYGKYKPFEYDEVKYDAPKDILARLIKLEAEINKDMNSLKGLLDD